MPQIVVTQTAKEYHDYTKKKARKELQAAITSAILALAGLAILFYLAWDSVHVGIQ